MRRLAAFLILAGLAMPAAAQTAEQRDALEQRVEDRPSGSDVVRVHGDHHRGGADLREGSGN